MAQYDWELELCGMIQESFCEEKGPRTNFFVTVPRGYQSQSFVRFLKSHVSTFPDTWWVKNVCVVAARTAQRLVMPAGDDSENAKCFVCFCEETMPADHPWHYLFKHLTVEMSLKDTPDPRSQTLAPWMHQLLEEVHKSVTAARSKDFPNVNNIFVTTPAVTLNDLKECFKTDFTTQFWDACCPDVTLRTAQVSGGPDVLLVHCKLMERFNKDILDDLQNFWRALDDEWFRPTVVVLCSEKPTSKDDVSLFKVFDVSDGQLKEGPRHTARIRGRYHVTSARPI